MIEMKYALWMRQGIFLSTCPQVVATFGAKNFDFTHQFVHEDTAILLLPYPLLSQDCPSTTSGCIDSSICQETRGRSKVQYDQGILLIIHHTINNLNLYH